MLTDGHVEWTVGRLTAAQLPPTGRLLDLGRFDALHAQLPPHWTVTHSEQFTARWDALPFADQTFTTVVLRNVLERIAGTAVVPLLHEACRVAAHQLVLPLTRPLAPATYAIQHAAGHYETHLSHEVLQQVLQDVQWTMTSTPLALVPGTLVCAHREALPC